MSDQFLQAPDVEDVDFQRHAAEKVYKTGAARGINPLRIERIHDEIEFRDLVSDITGYRGEKISCPFHGRDSDPSFLTRGGFGYCFGCPAGKGYYDHIRFVKEFYGLTWVQALRWIEKKYDLPPIADVLIEQDEDEEITTEVTFDDLSLPFINRAAKDVRANKDRELAMEYIHVYFSALNFERSADDAKKAREHEEANKLHYKAAMRLARVLGQKGVNAILDDKDERSL